MAAYKEIGVAKYNGASEFSPDAHQYRFRARAASKSP